MIKKWYEAAWRDYQWLIENDKKSLKKLNSLIAAIERDGYQTIGQPEPLRENLSGWWSYAINEKDRLICRISDDGTELHVLQCRTHYRDK
jgi:toxin YoeB